MNTLGARVRLVKGAYKEPRSVAYQSKADVDAAFSRIMQLLLREGTYPRDRHARSGDDRGDARVCARARHRPRSIRVPDAVRHPPGSAGVAHAGGLRVRVYVPFGREWFPYFMRRLGERPANIGFVLQKSLSASAEKSACERGNTVEAVCINYPSSTSFR